MISVKMIFAFSLSSFLSGWCFYLVLWLQGQVCDRPAWSHHVRLFWALPAFSNSPSSAYYTAHQMLFNYIVDMYQQLWANIWQSHLTTSIIKLPSDQLNPSYYDCHCSCFECKESCFVWILLLPLESIHYNQRFIIDGRHWTSALFYTLL